MHWTCLRVFALIWLIIPVVFFSFSGSKLTAYILPVLPAIALLVGERIALRARRRARAVTRPTDRSLVDRGGGSGLLVTCTAIMI